MAYKVTTGPTTEALTLLEVKNWLKIHPDVSEDDELIQGLIATARVWAEGPTGRALLTQTIQQVWDDTRMRCFDLSIGPLITVSPATSAIVSFEYRDSAGTYTTWASTNYTVDDVTEPGRVVVNTTATIPFPATAIYPNMIRITYTAGWASAAAVDPNIKTAMNLQIRLMYDRRESEPLASGSSPTATTAWNLLALSRTTNRI
jgi:uncharacterized phiE125 gp8 family phage protein